MSLPEQFQNTLKQLCVRYNVNQLYVFGSILTKNFQEAGDIDLIVSFDSDKIEDYATNYYNLKLSLEDLFKKPVDLLEEKALTNPYFKNSVEKQRQLVYG